MSQPINAFFNLPACEQYLGEVVEQYEKTAPTVAEFADSVYRRLGRGNVTLREFFQLSQLHGADGWEQPNYAANRIYHLMEELGIQTTGQAGF